MSDKEDPKRRHRSLETFLIHGNMHDQQWNYDFHVIPPITASTTFRLDSTARGSQGFTTFASPESTEPGQRPIYIYDRLAEPTSALLENAFKELEQGVSATAFASGMAAISGALLAICRQGDEVIAHRTLYGCTYSLLTNWLPRFGVTVRFADLTDLTTLDEFFSERTRAVYFESPANPTLELIDIAAAADRLKQLNGDRDNSKRAFMVVDNTFATPYCQRPRTLGADVVVHSLTKNVMGFGTDMGGMVVGPVELHEAMRLVRKDFGGVLSPRAAWGILVYGLQSLAVRMERQINTARLVAAWLENRPEVRRVGYPGLKSHPQHELAIRQMTDFRGRFAPGSMLYFELVGDYQRSFKLAQEFIDFIARESYVLTLAVSLGQAKTLIEAPVLMTHCVYGDNAAAAGINPSAVRLAIGLEEADDIIADLETAFDHIRGM